jgi:hypothetical protein
MRDAPISIEAIRARAVARHDGFLEFVENGGDTLDALGLLRVRVREEKANARRGTNPAIWLRLPAPRQGRVVVNGMRTMHVQILSNTDRTAADHDRYMTEERGGSGNEPSAQVLSEPGDVGAAELDAYATRDRTAPGDRPDEQVITNMPPTSGERRAIWQQIDHFENQQHKAGLDRINVHRNANPEFWAYVGRHRDCPVDFRDFLACAGRHRDAGKPLDKRRTKVGAPYIAEDARRLRKWLSAEFGKFAPGHVGPRPFKFSPGRQVVSERHGDIELPSELDEAAHRRIAVALKTMITAYATAPEKRVTLADGTEVEGRLPVVVAYHPPEAGNDQTNWHLHFLMHDRAIWIDEQGGVHFAVHKASALTRQGMVKTFRTDVENLINEELAAANAPVRVTTASLADLGSDASPQLKLGKELSRIEAAGELTERGFRNRLESWRRPIRANIEYVTHRQQEIDADAVKLERLIAKVAGVSSTERQALEDARRQDMRLQQAGLKAETDAWYAAYIIEMAESNLTKAIVTASRQRDLAATAQQKAKWAAEVDVLAAAHRDLLDELRPEIAARDHAQKLAADINKQQKISRASLVDAVDGFVRRKNQRVIEQLSASLTEMVARPDLSRLHRLVDRIDATPFVVTVADGLWGVTARDDRGGIFEGTDLSAPDIQERLNKVAAKHDQERKVAAAWLKKHEPISAHQESNSKVPEYVLKQLIRWQDRIISDEVAERQKVVPPELRLPNQDKELPSFTLAETKKRAEMMKILIDSFRETADQDGVLQLKSVVNSEPYERTPQDLEKSVNEAITSVMRSLATAGLSRHEQPSLVPSSMRQPTDSDMPDKIKSVADGDLGMLMKPTHPMSSANAELARRFHDPDWSPTDYLRRAEADILPGRELVEEQAGSPSEVTPAPFANPVASQVDKPSQAAAFNRAQAAFFSNSR